MSLRFFVIITVTLCNISKSLLIHITLKTYIINNTNPYPKSGDAMTQSDCFRKSTDDHNVSLDGQLITDNKEGVNNSKLKFSINTEYLFL